jgi:hypothetical protein
VRGPALVAAVLAFGVAAAPAEALTVKRAKQAVIREVRQTYDVRNPGVSCTRLTARRFRCQWAGLRPQCDGPMRGTARVTEYRGGEVDVTVRGLGCDY